MKLKKVVFILVFSLIFFSAFADDSYRLSVVSANDMKVSEDLVILEGGVEVAFHTVNNDSQKDRNLTADKVVINVDGKTLEALGNVYLSEGEDSTFRGEALSLNWDTLDVVVFGGTSSSDRTSSSGTGVKFFIVGDRISYSGKNDAVFFRDGVIATREKNPFWSVNAKKIALADSDIFFTNAVLKLGRVPIMWLPVFFYPGNRLSFNPAIGISSVKGKFLNTTYELYGSYSGLGKTGGSATDGDSDDASNIASNFLSFLNSGDDSAQIRSGWTYVSLEDYGELSALQKWAYDTGSYFAIFADAWEKYGLSIGFDTKNYLFNKKLVLSSIGALAYRDNEFRYSLDFVGKFDYKTISLDVKIPLRSDPDVRYEILNRNTVFGMDAAFGADQSFPSSYSSSETKYSMNVEGSASYTFKNIKLNLSSLKSLIDYEWDSKEKKYKITEATLPYVSFSSSGTLVDVSGKSTTKEETEKLNRKLAQKFYDRLEGLPEPAEDADTSGYGFGSLKMKQGSAVSTKKQVSSEAGSFKLDYTYNQVFDNDYIEQFEHSSTYNKLEGTIDLNGKLPGNLIKITESVNPSYTSTEKEKAANTSSFKLKNSSSLNVAKIGLTYKLSNYIYLAEESASKSVNRWGAWDKDDVLEHYLNLSNTVDKFKLGLKYVLPPLEQIVTPSVSYSTEGFSASTDMSFIVESLTMFKPKIAHASASYNYVNFSTSISSTYDFKKTGQWEGFSGTQNMAISFLENRIKLSQSLSLKEYFNIKELALGFNFDKSYVKYTMNENELNPDKLKIYLYYDVPAFYTWKNRVGFEGSVDFGFTYDFVNKYSSSLYTDAKINFSISRFIDFSLSVKSVNNSFYRYYEHDENNDEKFSFNLLMNDLAKSFDFFGNGRKSTGFNINSFSLSAKHYMEDWTLTLTSTSQIKTVSGKSKFVPEFTVLVQWKAIPELKTTNSWTEAEGWEK